VTGGQIAALILGLLMLLPGGCFVITGIIMFTDPMLSLASWPYLFIGIVILAVTLLLFCVAFRRRPPPPGSGVIPT